jgi:hypothetical protein
MQFSYTFQWKFVFSSTALDFPVILDGQFSSIWQIILRAVFRTRSIVFLKQNLHNILILSLFILPKTGAEFFSSVACELSQSVDQLVGHSVSQLLSQLNGLSVKSFFQSDRLLFTCIKCQVHSLNAAGMLPSQTSDSALSQYVLAEVGT